MNTFIVGIFESMSYGIFNLMDLILNNSRNFMLDILYINGFNNLDNYCSFY